MIPTMDKEAIGSEWVDRLIDGKYTLLQWLGSSDSGSVFLTENKKTSPERLAIKLLPAGNSSAGALLAGWRTATTLSHPHLLPVFDCGRCQAGDTSLIYSVTLYSDELLSQILAQRPLQPAEAEEMLKPVIDALSYLHGNGFVHGHLKPTNLMVVGDRLRLSSDRLEAVGASGAHHKPANVYDAPERGRKTLSPAADVWSLGVTLIEALVQHPPGWKPSMTRAPSVPKAVPEPYAAIARECLRRRPTDRCTLSEIKARLTPEPPAQIEPAAAAAPEAIAEAATEPAAEPIAETVAETTPEAAPETIGETSTEAAAETVPGAATEPATKAEPETAAKVTTEPFAQAAEPVKEHPAESVVEPAAEPIAEIATESPAETATESVTETPAEPAAETATEPAAETEIPAEPIPEFVPLPVTIPEPPLPRSRISSSNIILLGMLAMFVLVALVFHHHLSASPAGNQPSSSAPSAQASNPGIVSGQIVDKVSPDVPPSDSAKISGTITVKVLVTVDGGGKIVDAILNVPGPSPDLASLARQTAEKWSFKPAFEHGRPVQSLWLLEFQFSRNSTKINPFEISP